MGESADTATAAIPRTTKTFFIGSNSPQRVDRVPNGLSVVRPTPSPGDHEPNAACQISTARDAARTARWGCEWQLEAILPLVGVGHNDLVELRELTAVETFSVCELTAPRTILESRVIGREPNEFWRSRLLDFVAM
jgi:hypothetical protein